MNEVKKQLIIEIDEDLHSQIKIRATRLHTSIKKYVIAALEEKLQEDEKLNNA